jgi:hypothetical protein
MAFNIEQADVIWKWGNAYRGLGKFAENFIRYFVEDIRNCQMPGTKVEITQLKVGLIFGGRRDYIEVSADHLGDYRIFLGARAYGAHLSISMFLVSKPGLLSKRTTAMNTFEIQDLSDYLESTQISLGYALTRVAKEGSVELDQKALDTSFLPLVFRR